MDRIWVRWGALSFGILGLLTLLAANSPIEVIPTFAIGMHHAHQFALFILGVVAITWGLAGKFTFIQAIFAQDNRLIWGITLIGLLIRLPHLGTAVHYYVDEMHFAESILKLQNQSDIPILTNLNPIASFTFVYPYLQIYSTTLFGSDLAGLRIISVLFGTLMMPAVFILGSHLLNRQVGLIAAALLATFPPHIHFSRLALNNIADPFFGVWSIAFLLLGMQSTDKHIQRTCYVLAGVALGLTQYFYEGGRIVFPVLIICWLLLLLPQKNTHFHLSISGFARFFIAASLIAMPVLGMMLFWQAPLTPRLQDQAIDNTFWHELLLGDNGGSQLLLYFEQQFLPPLAHLFWQADGSAYYYGGETALLLPILLPFFVIGLVFLLRKWQAFTLLVLWLLLVILGNSLLEHNNWTARFVVLLVPLVVICAAGVDALTQFAAKVIRSKLIFAIVGILMTAQAVYYYGFHLPIYNQQVRADLDYFDTAYRTADLPDNTQAYLLTGKTILRHHLTTILELRNAESTLQWMHPFDFPYQQSHRLPNNQRYAFFIAPDDHATYLNLKRVFGARLTPMPPSPYNVPIDKQYDLYLVVDKNP